MAGSCHKKSHEGHLDDHASPNLWPSLLEDKHKTLPCRKAFVVAQNSQPPAEKNQVPFPSSESN